MEEKESEGHGEHEEKPQERTAKGEKKHKKRQKKMLGDLKKQIEFYFSEPNLQKDRFLRQKIAEHPQGCIEIATIASFNRMTQLCSDITLVVKAMKMCPSVEVIEDQWVKPAKPLSGPKNVDSFTIYVEKLPQNADHDWIKSLFSSCGKVVYVSLPRYKSTRDIKGFAFVEFENENEVKQALEMFDPKSKTEKEENDKDGEGKKETVYEPTGKQAKKSKKRKQKLSESENEDGKAKTKKSKHKREAEANDSISDSSCADTEKDNTIGSKKRKRTVDQESSDEKDLDIKVDKDGEMKKRLHESDDSPSTGVKRKRGNSDASDEDCRSSKKDKQLLEGCSKDTLEGEVAVEEDAERKHKKRKRKKKEKKETEVPNLKVISKLEWLRLKLEYQKLQREAMNETKMTLKNQKLLETENVNKGTPRPSENDTEIKKTEKSAELPAKLEMQHGVVLKYFTDETIETPRLRDIFSTIAPVAYLQKQDDEEMGFVRFTSKEGCEKVVEAVTNGSLDNIKVEQLTEIEDINYWERLNNDRTDRLQQKRQRKKQRGTQKITDKIEAQAKKRDHIHFNE